MQSQPHLKMLGKVLWSGLIKSKQALRTCLVVFIFLFRRLI
ncbi:hypothetical protein [Bacillus thuringiensis phage MZTP02]|uniref:Uncharacterized protein n=1 Tax=Bacillus thuringiensis phage MZTP02 TaxID=311221 RepID=Q58QF4_9CAUD|nr:hypothetical protein [Bacillus thuringiensis phage MZTP02]